ncbi:MAG: hypothetical protein HYR96_07190 [Deltaproteobacteria bacterium]|nr:hypothetical protein [Deltaproteobacteria bacterium]
MKSCTGSKDKPPSRGDAETEVSQLAETLTQIGKIAQDCSLDPTTNSLSCKVDFGVPPSGLLTQVNFSYTKNTGPYGFREPLPKRPGFAPDPVALVQYAGAAMLNPSLILKLQNPEAQAAPSPLIMQEYINSQWVTQRTFQNIQSVLICDDAAMTSGNCAIQPKALNDQHAANLVAAAPGKPTLAKRFYRIQITGVSPADDPGKLVQIQTAFYQRNPTSVSGLLYQWGMQE